MAESSHPIPQVAAMEAEEPQTSVVAERPRFDGELLEATELARLRRNYSRASTYRQPGSSTPSKKPTTLLERFTYAVSKFWKRQVSVVVPHFSCRDHLGTYPPLHSKQSRKWQHSLFPIRLSELVFRKSPALPCTKSSGTFTFLFHTNIYKSSKWEICQVLGPCRVFVE